MSEQLPPPPPPLNGISSENDRGIPAISKKRGIIVTSQHQQESSVSTQRKKVDLVIHDSHDGQELGRLKNVSRGGINSVLAWDEGAFLSGDNADSVKYFEWSNTKICQQSSKTLNLLRGKIMSMSKVGLQHEKVALLTSRKGCMAYNPTSGEHGDFFHYSDNYPTIRANNARPSQKPTICGLRNGQFALSFGKSVFLNTIERGMNKKKKKYLNASISSEFSNFYHCEDEIGENGIMKMDATFQYDPRNLFSEYFERGHMEYDSFHENLFVSYCFVPRKSVESYPRLRYELLREWKKISIWSVREGKEVQSLVHECEVFGFCVMRNRMGYIVSLDGNGRMSFWNTRKGDRPIFVKRFCESKTIESRLVVGYGTTKYLDSVIQDFRAVALKGMKVVTISEKKMKWWDLEKKEGKMKKVVNGNFGEGAGAVCFVWKDEDEMVKVDKETRQRFVIENETFWGGIERKEIRFCNGVIIFVFHLFFIG